MKKLLLTVLSLILTMSMLFAFVGCDSDSSDDDDNTKSSISQKDDDNDDTDNDKDDDKKSSKNSPDSAMKSYVKALSGKGSYKELAPDDMWDTIIELLMDEEDMTKSEAKEYLDNSMNEELEGSLEDLEDEFGKNIEFSYKILSTEKYKNDDYDEVCDLLVDEIGLDEDLIGEIGDIECELTVKGDDDSETEEDSIGYFEYDGVYYLEFVIEAFF